MTRLSTELLTESVCSPHISMWRLGASRLWMQAFGDGRTGRLYSTSLYGSIEIGLVMHESLMYKCIVRGCVLFIYLCNALKIV